ncbi:hypothetical protein DEA98_10190 [Brucella pseudogrignonensis]|uniref:Uncharacterized protein n=1 Tax=Brucella pseudogrignonensis TaxID=419475 RepID=A0A7Y3T8B4_9HYPH|nr:hypothetical protein [Brucella pseudogrignonensis]MCM0751566.1 hypothetical protein [Brucella pseudogrignonensis]NNV22040.1 hypothetical protein [Brucella pseudogrignonensis]
MTVTASGYDLKKNELYETEAWATEALLKYFPVRGYNVWESAAGNHKMADVLRANGAEVYTSDIETYYREHDEIFDFLSDRDDYDVYDSIVTNPPYGKQNRTAVKFAEKALERCAGNVALLLTAKFDSGKTRKHLFADNPRFLAKIVLVDRISWEGNGQTGTEDHAWYVWGPKPLFPAPARLLYAERPA